MNTSMGASVGNLRAALAPIARTDDHRLTGLETRRRPARNRGFVIARHASAHNSSVVPPPG
jgi:hypothetical protein